MGGLDRGRLRERERERERESNKVSYRKHIARQHSCMKTHQKAGKSEGSGGKGCKGNVEGVREGGYRKKKRGERKIIKTGGDIDHSLWLSDGLRHMQFACAVRRLRIDKVSRKKSAVLVDVGRRGSTMQSQDVTDPSSDENRNRKPVKDRVLKTVCLCVSFATMVRQFCIRSVYIHCVSKKSM